MDITQLVMTRHFINELEKTIERDKHVLACSWNDLRRKCMHPVPYIEPAGFAYDLDARHCKLCDQVI